MFYEAEKFNGDVSDWDVSSVKWMGSSVTDMDGMFDGASEFNSDVSSWDVSSVRYMSVSFYFS